MKLQSSPCRPSEGRGIGLKRATCWALQALNICREQLHSLLRPFLEAERESCGSLQLHHNICSTKSSAKRSISLASKKESKRAAAYFVGPGLGRTADVESFLKQLIPSIHHPSVIDADALFFLAKNRSWKIPPNTVLTPHHGEMERLGTKAPSLQVCQTYAKQHQTTVVLKGAPSIIFHPQKKPSS